MAAWSSGLTKEFTEGHYIVTDNDLDISGVPSDVCAKMIGGLQKYSKRFKVALSLDISDLPEDGFPMLQNVIEHESKTTPLMADKDFYAFGADTTFAMYRARKEWLTSEFYYDFSNGIRMLKPYTAKHLPWYWTLKTLTEEDIYYIMSCSSNTSQGWTCAIREMLRGNTSKSLSRYETHE